MSRLLTSLFRRERHEPGRGGCADGEPEYLRTYECFRYILSINDAALQLIADIDDRLLGQAPFNLEPIFQRIRKSLMEAALMINNLNEIAACRYVRLHDALGRIQTKLEAEIGDSRPAVPAGYVVPLEALRASDAYYSGSKMANLGEVRSLGFHVPEGFVITAEAFRAFMASNRLWEKAAGVECLIDTFSAELLDIACREIQQAILAAPLPEQIRDLVLRCHDDLSRKHSGLVAMRSSAIGEDGAASFAGKYYTELNVNRELLEDAYRGVVASMFNADAILYRFERGLNDGRNEMAVGCICMVDSEYSGVLFTRDLGAIDADRVVISTRPGFNVGITSGTQAAEEITIHPCTDLERASVYLSAGHLTRLRDAARRLETHFGAPQDIEWAVNGAGELFILQCRPMTRPRPAGDVPSQGEISTEPILAGGLVACPGAGAGPVYVVRSEADLQRFPPGGVVVARHSAPYFSRVMAHCAAIISEIGSPIGHMSILAREFGVPAIVGMKGALSALSPGQVVTVDATHARVYSGDLPMVLRNDSSRFPLADSPVVQRLRRVAHLISPLNLTDPSAPEFRPSGCQSLHDITRFVHEKVYEVMFRIGDRARDTHGNSFRLEVRLPLEIRVFDVGGGIVKEHGDPRSLLPSDIRSAPLLAFLEGLLDPRIRWEEPRPVSARGFMSVMGENIAGPPALARGVGGASFAVISDRYMNFSTKAGYHFSTLDVYCGQSQNKNYIHFKFHGGGAAISRRMRRIGFLEEVLAGLDFKVKTQGDFMTAQLNKYEREHIQARLRDLGRLTMCVRQLDMLMDSDAKASALAKAFLKGELTKF